MHVGRELEYEQFAKGGFGLGVALLVVGVLGNTIVPALLGPVPDWEHVVFVDAIAVGILVGLLSVFLFGIFLPLAAD